MTLTLTPVIKTNISCDQVLDGVFCEASCQAIAERCCKGSDLQIVIGDGLPVAAISSQVPALLPLMKRGAQDRGLSIGRAFVVHHCRVGILNEIGELLDPAVAVLLIGERPGLASGELVGIYGLSPASAPFRRQPKSRLQHSFSWSKLCDGRKANSEFSGANDERES